MIRQPKIVVAPTPDGDQMFEVHLGRPGKPTVYQVMTDTPTKEGTPNPSIYPVRRLKDNDPRLISIAKVMQEGRDNRRAHEAREAARRRTWRFRLARWFGERLGKITSFVARHWPRPR